MLHEYYDLLFPLNKDRLSFLLHICKENRVTKILDVGCSTGTYVLELSERGYRATGMDLDATMIKKAQERAKERGLTPSFLQGDMLTLDGLFNDTFQLITCCGNTLPHLLSPVEIRRSIRGMSQLLTSKGLFVIQIVNYDRVLKESITSLPTIIREGVSFERRYSLRGDGLIEFKGTLSTERGRVESLLPLYPIQRDELKEWMEEVGLIQLSFYHDFGYTPFTHKEKAPLGLVAIGRRGA